MLLAITLAVSVLMLGAVAQAADPMVGTWKLNLSKSKFDNHPAPKSHTIHVEDDGDMLRVRVVVESDGPPTNVSYSVKKDGKEYPVTVNGVPNVGTVIWRRVEERTTEIINSEGGKGGHQLQRVVISPDGRTQTMTDLGTDSKGQKYSIVAIWEKQ
jgi:hypothetical protein